MQRTSGVFITVEGGEGVGKSLFCKSLAKVLQERQKEVYLTHEPGGTPVGQAVRDIFIHPPQGDTLTPFTELFLVSAARSQHVLGPIKAHLDLGKWVLCDRFYDSTRVYQGVLGGLKPEVVDQIIAFSIHGMHPTLTFLLDCDVNTIMQRLEKRAELEAANRFDRNGALFHEKLRAAFLALAAADSGRFEKLDAGQPAQQVVNQAVMALERRGLLGDAD